MSPILEYTRYTNVMMFDEAVVVCMQFVLQCRAVGYDASGGMVVIQAFRPPGHSYEVAPNFHPKVCGAHVTAN